MATTKRAIDEASKPANADFSVAACSVDDSARINEIKAPNSQATRNPTTRDTLFIRKLRMNNEPTQYIINTDGSCPTRRRRIPFPII
jgi:hypothetical protein